MFWADRIAEKVEKKFGSPRESLVVRDEKTVSGRVHVGSMRGVAIHGVVAEALTDKNIANVFMYEFNDFDPMDDIPGYLPHEQFEKYLGVPLKNIPSPDGKAKSFAEYFADDFKSVIVDSGFTPEFYWGSDLYLSGRMNDAIREALRGAEIIRRVYKEVSGSQRDDSWLPINMICPQCGKMTTTRADSFNGSVVHFACKENAVEYTRGCGYEGNLSPFDGNAKLPWKVEWAAKWKVVGVQVEGGGKDHSTKGGSRDVANHISKEVFQNEPPLDIPYEFFLVGGKKMSSSKGRGSSAREIADLLPPKIFRLALLSKDINQAFNFDPEGDTIPVLYDLYDKLAEGYWGGVKDDYARLFTFIHPTRTVPEKMFLPRFSQVAFIVQMPHMDLEKEVVLMKNAPLTEADKIELAERATYAKKWLELCAPEKFIFKLQEALPEAVSTFSLAQKRALGMLADYVESQSVMPDGEMLHQKLHTLKEEADITPTELFSALYFLFLNKSHGPKAGWFLSVLNREFVIKHLRAASA